MSSVQEALKRMAGIQTNAQQALPILPNNGNPSGAYNMPPAPTAPAQAGPQGAGMRMPKNDYSWLQPSQYMRNIQDMLRAQMQPPVQAEQPPAVAQTNPAVPLPDRREQAMQAYRDFPLPRRRNEYIP